ncbi:MAG: DUF2189 domain-containing protein [Rhizomicrobium sp.]
MPQTIRNPIEWTGEQIVNAGHAIASARRTLDHMEETAHSPAPAVRKITIADVKESLAKGFEDFEAYRSDVLFVGIIYAAVGLVLARVAFGSDLIPLVFPLASGFAIIGPFAAIGLYELSRRREQGAEVTWANAFDVFKAPAIGGIVALGVMLVLLFLSWLAVAWLIFALTLGPAEPASIGAFARDVFTTPAGWTMIVAGVGVGFLFAVLAMAISVVSFPMLIDRDVGLDTAIATSVRAVKQNPVPMAAWGLIVAASLVLGSIPLFIGLVAVVPILGHATWHLYRRLVAR